MDLLSDETRAALSAFPKARKERLLQHLNKALQLVTHADRTVNDDVREQVLVSFSERVRIEKESYDRMLLRAAALRHEERQTKRIAFLITGMIFLSVIGLGLVLSDERRLYSVHEWLAKWYYFFFVHDQSHDSMFLGKDEAFDLYA